MVEYLQQLTQEVWTYPDNHQLLIAALAAVMGATCFVLNALGKLGWKVTVGALALLWKGGVKLTGAVAGKCRRPPYEWTYLGGQLLHALDMNPRYEHADESGTEPGDLANDEMLICDTLRVNLTRCVIHTREVQSLNLPWQGILERVPAFEQEEILKRARSLARAWLAEYGAKDAGTLGAAVVRVPRLVSDMRRRA